MQLDLQFKNIHAYNTSLERTKKGKRSYYWAKPSADEISADKMTLFVSDAASKDESKHNLEQLQDYCKQEEYPYFSVSTNRLQFIGGEYSPACTLELPTVKDSNERYHHWRIYNSANAFESENQLWCESYYLYQSLLIRSEMAGVYDAKTMKKLTRRDAIQKFWDLGFVTARGRPVMAASRGEVGHPNEVARITNLASEMQYDVGISEVAGKVVATWKALKKNYAWPGTW